MKNMIKQCVKTISRKILPSKIYKELSTLYWTRKRGYKINNLIQKNRRYKDIHKGERCFIMGNGPSLNTVDLKSLADETVFVVNFFDKISGWEEAKPDYHFLMDANFFGMRKDKSFDENELLAYYDELAKYRMETFVPCSAFPYFRDNGLENKLNLNYIYFDENIIELSTEKFRLDRKSTGFNNVVQFCIEAAIYMGFQEIYLIGCDATAICYILDLIKDGVYAGNSHAYDNGKEVSIKKRQKIDIEWIMYDQYKVFEGYKRLKDYCDRIGVKLYNCSKPTLITSIPQIDIADVLKNKTNKNGAIHK